MASKCEDHMDLGGFLQTYVLGNPFQSPNTNVNTTSNSKPQSPVVCTPKQKTKRKASSEQNDTNGHVSPILIVPSMQKLDSRSSGDDGSQPEDPFIGLPDAPIPVPTTASGDGNSFGHVGSNAAYALSLEKRKVADAHRPVQAWLLMNYQFCAHVPAFIHCLYGNRLLLSEVQAEFPNTSSIVLSRIIKFTFPQCSKIINKSGTFWQGLLKQPQVPHPAYISAAQALQHSNEWEDVLKSYDLSGPHDALTVTSLLYWRDSQGQRLDLDYLEQLYQEEFEEASEPWNGNKTESPEKRLNNTKGESSKKTVGNARAGSPRKMSPPRKCKQRSSLMEKFVSAQQGDGEQSNEDTNDDDYCPSHPSAASRAAGRKRKKSKPVKRTLSKTSPGFDDDYLNVIGEVVTTDHIDDITDSASAAKRKRSTRSRSASVSPAPTSACLAKTKEFTNGEHTDDLGSQNCDEKELDLESNNIIKQEPIDSDDQQDEETHSKKEGENRLEFGDKDENENCDFDTDHIENSHATPDASEDETFVYRKCLAENQQLKTSLKSVQYKLSFSKNKTRQLSSELCKCQEEVKGLRSQLSDKESQLFEVARDFSDLSDKFKQFANKLQVALLENSNNSAILEAFSTNNRDLT